MSSASTDVAYGIFTEKVVHNFFTPASKKPPEAVRWSVHDGTLLRGRHDGDGEANDVDEIATRQPAKVAAFDFVSRTRKTL